MAINWKINLQFITNQQEVSDDIFLTLNKIERFAAHAASNRKNIYTKVTI